MTVDLVGGVVLVVKRVLSFASFALATLPSSVSAAGSPTCPLVNPTPVAPSAKTIFACEQALAQADVPLKKVTISAALALAKLEARDFAIARTFAQRGLTELDANGSESWAPSNARLTLLLVDGVAATVLNQAGDGRKSVRRLAENVGLNAAAARVALDLAKQLNDAQLVALAEAQRYRVEPSVPGLYHRLVSHMLAGDRQQLSDVLSWIAVFPSSVTDGDYVEAIALIETGKASDILGEVSEDALQAVRRKVNEAQAALSAAEAQPKETIGDRLRGAAGARDSRIFVAKRTLEVGQLRLARLQAIGALALQSQDQWDAAAPLVAAASKVVPQDPWINAASIRQSKKGEAPSLTGLLTPTLATFQQARAREASIKIETPGLDLKDLSLTIRHIALPLFRAVPSGVDADWKQGVGFARLKSGGYLLLAQTSGLRTPQDLETALVQNICKATQELGAKGVFVKGRFSQYFKHDSGFGQVLGAALMASLGGDDGDPYEIETKPDWRTNDDSGKDINRKKRVGIVVMFLKENANYGVIPVERLGCGALNSVIQ